MGPALVFQAAKSATPFYGKRNFLKAAQLRRVGIKKRRPPAPFFGVARIHAKKVGGEKGRFLAADAAAYFHDNVLVVVWILRQKKRRQLLFQRFPPLFKRRQLLCRQPAKFVVQRFFKKRRRLLYLQRRLFIGANLLHHRRKLGVLLAQSLKRAHIGQYFRVAEPRFDFPIFIFYRL